jgi:PTS system nitrogen regulatory IIA component
MRLSEFLGAEQIVPELQGRSKPEIIAELAQALARTHAELDAKVLTRVLLAREELASTAVGDEIAIPHSKIDSVDRLIGVVGRSAAGVDFDSLDGRPTHLFFALIAPGNFPGIHLKALARISYLFKSTDFRASLMTAPTADAMFRLIDQADTLCSQPGSR